MSAAASGAGLRTTIGRGQRRAQRVLVSAQIAVSFVVLVGAGLLVRTFIKLQNVDPGFETSSIVTLKARNFTQASAPANRALFDTLTERLSAFPGVQSVALSSRAPFDEMSLPARFLHTEDGRYNTSQSPIPMLDTGVSAPYFSTLGIPILGGRLFQPSDTATATPVAIINESMARAAFGDANPINRRLQWSWDGTQWLPWRTIVGVARDVHEWGAGRPVLPTIYLSSLQTPAGPTVLIRTAGDTGAVEREAARLIHTLDPKRPISDVWTLSTAAAEQVAPSRLNATLFGGFAVVALTIAAIGIGGVLAFSVSERTREFGIRMALGSDRGQVLRGVLGEGAWLAGAGLALGMTGALLLSRFLAGLLYEVTPLDAVTYAITAFGLVSVALGASWLPARRATEVDPIVALRAE